MAKITIKTDDGSFFWSKRFDLEDIYYMLKESWGLLDALNKAGEIDDKEPKK